jgi:hypothetical protein
VEGAVAVARGKAAEAPTRKRGRSEGGGGAMREKNRTSHFLCVINGIGG